MIISVDFITYDSSGMQHAKNRKMLLSDVAKITCNFACISNLPGLSNICIDNDFIFQASGYTLENGLYTKIFERRL